MFKSNHHLLGFLQKKSLFKNHESLSPAFNKQYERKESDRQLKTIQTKQLFKSNNNSKNNIALNQFTPPKNVSIKDIQKKVKFQINKISNNKFEQNYTRKVLQKQKQSVFSKSNLGFSEYLNQSNKSSPKRIFQKKPEKVQEREQKSPSIPKNFQSSKTEVKMCLEDLYNRVGIQLKLIEKTITEMTASLESIFYSKMNQIRHQIIKTIEEMFNEVKSTIEPVVSQSKQDSFKDILKIKHRLRQTDNQLQNLKLEMDQNWRKVAGEVLSGNIDTYIEQIIQQSRLLRQKIQRTDNLTIKKSPYMTKQKSTKKDDHDNFLVFRQSLRKLINSAL